MVNTVKLLSGTYGKLTIINISNERTNQNRVQYLCKCVCGKILTARGDWLLSGDNISCGCSRRQDITNRVFSNLTALEPTDEFSGRTVKWLCRCKCGNIVKVALSNLNNGNTKSCGCLHSQNNLSHTPEYRAWYNLIERCTKIENSRFKDYGGRGIAVCERWLYSFQNFLSDMGFRPSSEHSIDRVNNDGNYEPGNCKWSTPTEQANNRRNNVFN